MTRTYIVGDISSNHLGNMDLAKSMIEIAARIGLDCVKFQSWQADKLRKDFPDYVSTYTRHKKTELSDKDHFELFDHCKRQKIDFLTTCFDIERAPFLASLGINQIKVASPDCGSVKLLETLMKYFKKLIISTGMTPEEEIFKAVEVTRGHDVVFLHCVSLYPTPLEKMNLSRMEWLKSLNVKVGLSDHSLGVDAGKVVISRKAEILEKHFTLSCDLPGKDQAMSTTPEEMAELVQFARAAEVMEGNDQTSLSSEEEKMRSIYVGKWGDNR